MQFGKKLQQSDLTVTFDKSHSEKYGAYGDLAWRVENASQKDFHFNC